MTYTQFTLDVTVEHDPEITIEEIIKGIWALVGTTVVERHCEIGSAQLTHTAVVDEVSNVSRNAPKAGDTNVSERRATYRFAAFRRIGVPIADVVPEGQEFAAELTQEGVL